MKQKIQIEKEVDVCDICEKELKGHYSKFECLNCHALYCLFHSYDYLITYPGSNLRGYIPNGYFCKACDVKLLLNNDPLHVFYRKLQKLADEFDNHIKKLDELKIEYDTISNP